MMSQGSQPMASKRPDPRLSLDELMALSMQDGSAEPAFFAALLEATVYVHAPAKSPPGRLQLVSFPHPETGTYLVPFFTDRQQADEASSAWVRVMALTGRRLFEITPGATLILNPNRRHCILYPEEIAQLLQGRVLAPPFKVDTDNNSLGALEPAVSPPSWLASALVELYSGIPGVESASIARRVSPDGDSPESLVVIAVVSDADVERTGRASIAALKEGCELSRTSLEVLTLAPGSEHPCAQFPKVYVRSSLVTPEAGRCLH